MVKDMSFARRRGHVRLLLGVISPLEDLDEAAAEVPALLLGEHPLGRVAALEDHLAGGVIGCGSDSKEVVWKQRPMIFNDFQL